MNHRPRTVTVVGGETVTTTFEVSCTLITGAIEVTTATAGDDPDSDGYTVILDGGEHEPIDPAGTVSFTELTPGDYELALSGVADNCAVEGANPRTVTVVGYETTATTFDVGCERIERIAFESTRSGDLDIWVMHADGSNEMNLTNSLCSVGSFDPRWSPDGTWIAFRCQTITNSEIWVTGADGSNPTNLTNHSAHDGGHAWQP